MNDLLAAPYFARLTDYIGPWMIHPPAFHAIFAVARAMDLETHVRAMTAAPRPVSMAYETVEAKNGRKVAIVRLVGPMMKGQSSFGGASTIAARRALRQASADSEIAGIVLAADTPGGTVAGTADLATDVRAAARRKPVITHADDNLASAGYWAGSQADEVWANSSTAMIGSIGTILTVEETAGRAERLGMRERVFTTGPLKAVGGDQLISDEQATYLQSIADRLQVPFDEAVKKSRRLSAAQMTEVRSGAIYPAADAERLGLINGVRSLEATIEALASAK